MEQFLQNDLQLLVATTVIEVGVDVSNATVMVIEHSERMGLSGLHQLRGRVGRGSQESTCILLYKIPLGELAKKRLKVISNNTDGFKIAYEDMLIRGPGDNNLIPLAKQIAKQLLNNDFDLANNYSKLWFVNINTYLKA